MEFYELYESDDLENNFKDFFKNKDYSIAKDYFSDLYLATIFKEWNKVAKSIDDQLVCKLNKAYLTKK